MDLKRYQFTSSIASAAIFLSGSGSNAEKLIESLAAGRFSSWKAAVLFTDNPAKSRASEISARFSIPLESLDIRKFYLDRGETRVSILSDQGQKIREEWTARLREVIRPYGIDFGILAGFVPLTNIISDFPCLNVHPGDLTVEEDGRRVLAGLHSIPVENAILRGHRTMRSSVIIAQPYTGCGGEMDTGPILGVSEEVPIDFMEESLDHLKDIASRRPSSRPPGGFRDILDEVARHNQEILKVNGDWTVFPPAVDDFASGRFATSPEGRLHFLDDSDWKEIRTVVYGRDSRMPIARK